MEEQKKIEEVKKERRLCEYTGFFEKCDGKCGECDTRENSPSTSMYANGGGE